MRAGHLGAIDRWIRISESRRKLLGLDAPTRVEMREDVDLSGLSDAELDQMIANEGRLPSRLASKMRGWPTADPGGVAVPFPPRTRDAPDGS